MLLYTPCPPFSLAIRDVVNHPCPISSLPTELLQEIFAFSMVKKAEPSITINMSQDEIRPPGFQATAMFLTWVCSRWRQIALSTPELWGTVIIYKPKKYCIKLVELYLSRSGNSTPLDLELSQNPVMDLAALCYPEVFPEHEVTMEILRIWFPFAHRWRSIDLKLSYTPPLDKLPDLPNALSSLQEARLEFGLSPGDRDAVLEWFWGHIFRSPKLRRAYWTDLHRDRRRLPLAPFQQLEEFTLFYPTVDQLLYVLPECSRLKRLDVTFDSSTNTLSFPSSPILLPCLEHIIIELREELPEILDYLTAPLLQKLVLSDTRKSPFSDVHSFLQRSRCTLRVLQLWRWADQEEPFIAFLSNASAYLANLEVLTIRCNRLSERTISLFRPQFTGDTKLVPFPSLLNLDLYSCETEDGVISSMVQSRSAAGAPLRFLRCGVECGTLNTSGYSKDEAAFVGLCQGGLQLSWNSPDEVEFFGQEKIERLDVGLY